MKRKLIIEEIKKDKRKKIQTILEKLLNFLDDFFYYVVLFLNTTYSDVFYFLYIEKEYLSYTDIAVNIGKNDAHQVFRIAMKINNFIYLIILEEPEYKKLKEIIS